jgi:predicted nucleic acid-binding Zn ribbon protein
MGRSEPEKIGSILNDVLIKFGLKQEIERHKALFIWNQVVGKEIASHTKPGWITNGILWIMVDDSIWCQELEFLKNQIREKINLHLSSSKIRGIKFIQRGWKK